MASDQQSPEARELSLIDKVEFRIALADTDAKLQSILNTYLAPLLLKLTSEHVTVRNKVISVCQHVNKRVAPENIRLPVAALLNQFKEYPQSQLVRHFDLIYSQQGLPRLTPQERAQLVPVLASGIGKLSSTSASHAAVVFNLFLRCLNERPLPPRGSPEDENLRSALELSDVDAKFLSTWISKLLLLKQTASQTNAILSTEEVDFLTLQKKPEVWDPSATTGMNLTNVKVATLKFISSGAFKDSERLLPGLFASADPNSRLSDTGDGLVKQTVARVSVDDDALVRTLYKVYEKSSSTLSLRIKILNFLAKSKISTSFTDEIVRLVNQGLVENTDRIDREVTKLRAAIIQYLGFAARNADKSVITTIARNVIEKLKDFLDQRHADAHSPEMRALRGKCFEIVGLLASIDSDLLFEYELGLLRWMFRSLAEESDKEVVFSIDDAISSSLKPFQRVVDTGIQNELKSLLVDVLTLDSTNQRNTCFACLRFANRCLPFSDTTARWIDIAALGSASDDSHEIQEEARKGLDPYWHWLLTRSGRDEEVSNQDPAAGLTAPDFTQLTNFIFKSQRTELDNTAKWYQAVTFARRCLFWACLYPDGRTLDTAVDWERKMDLAITSDQDNRASIRSTLLRLSQRLDLQQAIQLLFDSCLHGLTTDSKARPEFASIVLEIVSLSPDSVVKRLVPSAHVLTSSIMGNELETRRLAARTFGVLDSHPEADRTASNRVTMSLLDVIATRKSAVGAQLNKIHGALLCMAYVISRRKLRGFSSTDLLEELLPVILDIIKSSNDSMLKGAAYQALSQLCMFFVLDADIIGAHQDITSIIDVTTKDAKAGNEQAIAALGHLAMIFDEDQHSELLETILDRICSLHEIRQIETQFAVGEAITCLGFGWASTALFANLDVAGSTPASKVRTQVASKTVEKILSDCKTTKPSMKKASVIWLLCLLQFGATREEVQKRLPQFQAAFKRCLSDRDELVQESASRGLGLVYEKGDRSLKDSLVRDLVASFTTNRAETSGTVTEDTQLFEPGALPTGDGSITTYKDIMSLASEVGDSSLVYRFMSLASNNAIWSSRAAFGRFGLSNVLSDSSVDGYLATNPKLYPKLYRYRFDPNTNVRRSMNDIWNALVKDPTKTLEVHFEAILNDLLVNIVGREWRARQASCAAVADLIQGRNLVTIQPHLDRIWSLCFKVLDDIKESVRGAAGELARVLTNILLRNLESSEGKEAALEKLLGSVLSFLLSTSGLESGAKEVQGFSLHTLLEIIKKSKPESLRPFLPDLVGQILGFLSTFEPEAVNYVALNASNYNLQQSDIDDIRLKSIRSSPLMEAIERCLDMLDEKTMEALMPKLQEALKVAVGVPSKVGFSRVLVTLSTRCNFVFRPHADVMLSAVQKRIMDRNETVSSSYAAALGYVARLASNEQLIKMIGFAQKLYFGEEASDRPRLVAGEILQAFARHSTDRYTNLASELFPFVFFGKFDDEKRVRDVFQETFNETVSGPRAVTLHLTEVIELASAHLGSNKWTFKHAGALAISDAVKSVAASQGSISAAQCTTMWPGLRTALAEKSWEGKEKILDGFATFAEKNDKFLESHEDVRLEVMKIAIREAKRRNKSYQAHALVSLGQVATVMPAKEDNFEAIMNIATLTLDEALEQESQDKQKEEATGRQEQSDCVAGAVAATFGALKARLSGSTEGRETVANTVQALKLARRAIADEPVSSANTQSRVYGEVKSVCEIMAQHPILLQYSEREHAADDGIASAAAEVLGAEVSPVQERQRLLRSEALRKLVSALLAARMQAPPKLSAAFTRLLSDEKSRMIRSTLEEGQRLMTSI